MGSSTKRHFNPNISAPRAFMTKRVVGEDGLGDRRPLGHNAVCRELWLQVCRAIVVAAVTGDASYKHVPGTKLCTRVRISGPWTLITKGIFGAGVLEHGTSLKPCIIIYRTMASWVLGILLAAVPGTCLDRVAYISAYLGQNLMLECISLVPGHL